MELNLFRYQVWWSDLSSLETLKNKRRALTKGKAILVLQQTLNGNVILHNQIKLGVKMSMIVKYFVSFNSLKNVFFLFEKLNHNFYLFPPFNTDCMLNPFTTYAFSCSFLHHSFHPISFISSNHHILVVWVVWSISHFQLVHNHGLPQFP